MPTFVVGRHAAAAMNTFPSSPEPESCSPLYAQWRQVAQEHRPEIALRELATGRSWTYGQLLQASDGSAPPTGPLVFPRGTGAEFILEVLRGWRHQRVVCPLEPGQRPPEVPAPPAGIVHLKTTSATTGTARLVAFRASQLRADPANIVATMGLRPDWPNLGLLSLAHSYGFSSLVLPLLLHGIPLVLGPAPLPDAVRRAAASGPEWTVAAVPALWRAWLEADAIPSATRLAISAGAPLPLDLEQAVHQRLGLKIHNFYGSTECGGIAYDGTDTPRTDPGVVGRALQGVNLSASSAGCLVVQGDNTGETYWPEPSAELQNGRFQTSDLVEFVGDVVCLRGRAGDVINVAGRKVAPDTIERVLRLHPAVRECLVLALPDPVGHRGDAIGAVVGIRSDVDVRELQSFLQERLPDWQVPRRWHLTTQPLANERGKISRAEWRRQWPGV